MSRPDSSVDHDDREPNNGQTEDRCDPDRTPVGVDLGVKTLAAAAPADGDPSDALTIDGDHVRRRYEILTEATRALHGAPFDTTRGEIQLFAAMWRQIRPQVYDAAVRVVRYAREQTAPTLVLERLPYTETALWTRRTASDLGTWLLPALAHAVRRKARAAEVPVRTVDATGTTQLCHDCGNRCAVGQHHVECVTDDCPVGAVSRDRSAALSIARRVAPLGSAE